MSKQTTVGAGTQISGNLQGEQDLWVHGRIDGSIELTSTLHVEPEGVVVAEVRVAQAMISGTVVGNINATDLVHIAAEGRVIGDIVAPRVVMVGGASFRGEIDMGDFEVSREAGAIAEASRERRPVATAEVAAAHSAPPRPAPRPPRPPQRIEREVAFAAEASPGDAGSLEHRASVAAQAVARAVKKDAPPTRRAAAPSPRSSGPDRPAGKTGSSPAAADPDKKTASRRRPPTTAGKKTRVRRK